MPNGNFSSGTLTKADGTIKLWTKCSATESKRPEPDIHKKIPPKRGISITPNETGEKLLIGSRFWQAFRLVKKQIRRILASYNRGIYNDLLDILCRGHVKHRIQKHMLDDGA